MKITKRVVVAAAACSLAFLPMDSFAQSTYKVQRGDTLWGISQRFGVPLTHLMKWNSLTGHLISLGQPLKVQAASAGPVVAKTHQVKKGDTLWSISRTYKVSVAQLKSLNGLSSNSIRLGQVLKVSSASAAPAPAAPTVTTATVTASLLNVRSGPSVSHTVSFRVTKGTKATVLQQQNGWAQLSVGGKTGWVNASYLSLSSTKTAPAPTPSPSPAPQVTTGTVTATLLNVRSGPSVTYPVSFTAPKGTKGTVLQQQNGWAKLSVGGKTGWVNASYLSLSSGSAASPAPAPAPAPQTYEVNATWLNVRSGPSTSYGVVFTLRGGSSVSVSATSNGWAKVTYGSQTGWVNASYLTASQKAVPNGKTVIVDPGHGGVDSGAIGTDGTHEEAIALQISLKTQQALASRGYKVVMVRTSDTSCHDSAVGSKELQCRVDLSKTHGADVYLSIHANSATAAARGTETFYSPDGSDPEGSERLARVVHAAYQPAMNSLNRGVKTANFYVIKNNTVPSILLEIGFMSNSSDLSKMQSSATQSAVASAIARGVDAYFTP